MLSIDFVLIYFEAYIFIPIDFMCKVQAHVQQFENICKPYKKKLFYINNDDDAINCTMHIPSTYKKFVFMEFNKKHYNSNMHI